MSLGDVVEVRMGRPPKKQDHGVVNTLRAVRQSAGEGSAQPCRWQPDDPSLWMRILYCDRIEDDGWIEHKGINKAWIKPMSEPLVAYVPVEAAVLESQSTVTSPLPTAIVESASAEAPAAIVPSATNQSELAACSTILVAADAAYHPILRDAAGKASPPLGIIFDEATATDVCEHTIHLRFESSVDRTSQQRNADGAAALGLLGAVVGAVTPWACTVVDRLSAEVRNRSNQNLAVFMASREHKKVGTMLICGNSKGPSDTVASELASEVVQQIAASPFAPRGVPAP